MTLDATQLEEGFALFEALIHSDPDLAAELEPSRREFFRGATPAGPASLRRHLEWFLFERIGRVRHELAIERLLPAWREQTDPELAANFETYLTSHPGIFRVGRVEPGHGAWLSDLTGLGEYPVDEPLSSAQMKEGDLLVGRLFAVGEGVYRISPGSDLFRSPELAAAIERDLERLREDRAHAVLRVGQIELEAMFFGAGALSLPVDGDPEAPDPVVAARAVLAEEGLSADRIEQSLQALASMPFDTSVLVPGAGDALGAVLVELAFESEVDLERARAALLLAWAHMWKPKEETVESKPQITKPVDSGAEDQVRVALERFTEARRVGGDLEGCFDELERDLGLIGESEEDALDPTPDFPGVVNAVIEEFLWQRSLEGAKTDSPEYDILKQLGGFTEQVGVIENLEGGQVQGFAALWLPDRVDFADEEAASRALGALREFVAWLASEHAIELGESTDASLAELEREMPRVAAVNRRLGGGPAGAPNTEAESWFEVERGPDQSDPQIIGPGGLRAPVPVEPEVAELLASGDWLRFELDAGGRSRPMRCFPPQAGTWLSTRQTSRS